MNMNTGLSLQHLNELYVQIKCKTDKYVLIFFYIFFYKLKFRLKSEVIQHMLGTPQFFKISFHSFNSVKHSVCTILQTRI